MYKVISVIINVLITSSFAVVGATVVETASEETLKTIVFNNVQVEKPTPIVNSLIPKTFIHGDCSWIAPVALKAGWGSELHEKLIYIILRESGCCPNRVGGDQVDKNCNIIRVSEWNHRSDTGLLQINGVHWKKDHEQYHGLVCKRMKICSQKILLEPLNNLMAGKLLYDEVGWSPWNVIVKP